MSLTTEEIIGGMHRAHRAGQSFAALMANPLFANLPLDQKQKVLGGLHAHIAGESPSTAGAIATLLKGMAGGAASAIPVGIAIPLGMELAEDGTKRSVLEALKMAAGNKKVKMLVGTGAAIGAAGGLARSAFNLYSARQDSNKFKAGLAEAAEGGEGLAGALFGAIGGRSAPSTISTASIAKELGNAAAPNVMASARLGHLNSLVTDADTDGYNAVYQRAMSKAQQGYPLSPSGLNAVAERLTAVHPRFADMHNLVLNSQSELNIDPSVATDVADDIASGQNQNAQNVNNLNALAELALQLRDIKRGNT